MLDHLPLWLLLAIFVVCGVVIWFAGIQLSKSTDALDDRLHLGNALGGLIVLAVATNLPEFAITVTAAISGQISVAVGDVLGGIALQTVVIVILDAFGKRKHGAPPLTYRAASLTLVIEAIVVLAVLMIVVAGTQLPKDLDVFHVTPQGVLILLAWLAGLLLVRSAGRNLPWDAKGDAPDSTRSNQQQQHQQHQQQHGSRRGSSGHGQTQGHGQKQGQGHGQTQAQGKGGSGSGQQRGSGTPSLRRALLVFAAAAIATLVAGFFLEQSGDFASKQVGLSGLLFGATVLALATSLPEISTGLQALRQGDDDLAISDIFGGNAFLPVLFLVAALISGKAPLPTASSGDIYLTAVAGLLTAVYALGLLFRPKRRIIGLGVDSFAVLVLYLLGIAGLFAVV